MRLKRNENQRLKLNHVKVKQKKKKKKKRKVRSQKKGKSSSRIVAEKLIKIVKKEKKKKKKKVDKAREKAIKGLLDFNEFIRNKVVGTGQQRSFILKAKDVKQEIIDSYRRWKTYIMR